MIWFIFFLIVLTINADMCNNMKGMPRLSRVHLFITMLFGTVFFLSAIWSNFIELWITTKDNPEAKPHDKK